jgi:hypothetical protein
MNLTGHDRPAKGEGMLLTTNEVLRRQRDRAGAHLRPLGSHAHQQLLGPWLEEIEDVLILVERHGYHEETQARALGLSRLFEAMLDYVGAPRTEELGDIWVKEIAEHAEQFT